GMQFYDMNASVTSSTFEVTEVPTDSDISFLIALKTGLTSVRADSDVVVTAGANNIPFTNLGTTDCTVFLFDVNYPTNTIPHTLNADSIDIIVPLDTKINYIIIVNP